MVDLGTKVGGNSISGLSSSDNPLLIADSKD